MDAETCLPCLPPDVVTRLLQHVNLQQRLSICALVCHAWHTAAVAATTTIAVSMRGSTMPSLEQWLHRNGNEVTSIDADGSKDGLSRGFHIPFKHLKQLQHLGLTQVLLPTYDSTSPYSTSSSSAYHSTAPYSTSSSSATARASSSNSTTTSSSSSSSSSNMFSALAATLTSLAFVKVSFPGKADLQHVAMLTNLRELQLKDLREDWVEEDEYIAPVTPGTDLGSALGQLTQLTRFALRAERIEAEVLAHVSCLQQLASLELDGELAAGSLAELPLSLTRLQLHVADIDIQFSSSSTPRLALLTNLQDLTLRGAVGDYHINVTVHPELLSSLVQLQRLALQWCRLHNEASVHTWHSVLLQLTELQHLDVRGTKGLCPDPVPLTLTHLDLRDCEVPAALFTAPGRQLPGLRVLQLGREHQRHVELPGVFGPGDVCSLASCCPGLQELWLIGSLTRDVQLTELHHFTGITALTVGEHAVNDQLTEQVLVQLTGLQRLCVRWASNFTYNGVTALTALKQLQALEVVECKLYPDADDIAISSQASPPDVWQQLLAHFAGNSSCWRTMQNRVQELDLAVAGAKEEVAVLQQQLVAEQQRSAELQQQVLAANQQAADWRDRFDQSQEQLALSQQQAAAAQQQLAQRQLSKNDTP